MSQITLSLNHGQTLDEARTRMRSAVSQLQGNFSAMVQGANWSSDQNACRVTGKGFEIDMRVDDQKLHITGNLTFLGGLLNSPITAGLKRIVEKTFQKQLPP